MNKNDNYTNVLLEDINGKFDAIMEIVASTRQELTKVKKDTSEIPAIAADLQAFKYALTETNKDVRDHERRITQLEALAA